MAAFPSSLRNRASAAVVGIFWPPGAPVFGAPAGATQIWWSGICLANVLPITAILHNRVFWVGSCMLNPFGSDYMPSVVGAWLLRDPSVPWAAVFSGIAWSLGNFCQPVKALMAPVFSSCLPLTIWIWDIPFSGRYICLHFHDHLFTLYGGHPLATRDICLLSALIYLIFLALVFRKMRVKSLAEA